MLLWSIVQIGQTWRHPGGNKPTSTSTSTAVRYSYPSSDSPFSAALGGALRVRYAGTVRVRVPRQLQASFQCMMMSFRCRSFHIKSRGKISMQ